ncbi:TerC family protein [Polynucleobacter kasalickyi]|uniref:Integral membrane protein, YjbE family n=1 Tax=Polynucleobacter kasalickyi TaxID=1938817 RepID=A0A1W1YK38_9BURK|nr:TerC family protein [Polynucleobacter kasalickyi]SMC36509.1 integral membrane protein, YjbE family [Polynucleobacter kasalickyi]
MDFTAQSTWIALGMIMFTNIILSGDNAVVIAMASRNLPKEHQKRAIFWGSAAAIILRVILTLTAVQLLTLPYLKIIGAVLLVYIGVQLLAEGDDEDDGIEGSSNLLKAVKTILIADLVMSLDNVIAVVGVANKAPEEARIPLILIGLALSIPLIIFGSTILLKIMDRFPFIVVLGAGLLGLLAGEMVLTDPSLVKFFETAPSELHWVLPILGIASVLAIGYTLKRKHQKD